MKTDSKFRHARKLIRRYMKELKKALPIRREPETRFLHDTKQALYDYAESMSNDFITYDDLIQNFGDPLECSSNYILSMDVDTLRDRMTYAHHIKLVLISAFLLIVGTSVAVSIFLHHERTASEASEIASTTVILYEGAPVTVEIMNEDSDANDTE